MWKRAFTLIEVLVVVAIVAILAALLFPVFTKARERARRTVCASNLRQLWTAMQEYVDDSDGRFPAAYGNDWVHDHHLSPSWPDTLAPYLSSTAILKCPSDIGETYPSDTTGTRARGQPFYARYPSSYFWPGYGGFWGLVPL